MDSCRNIKRIKGNNVCHGLIDMAGGWLVRISHSLTELRVDNSQLYSLSPHTVELYSVDREYSRFLFMYCGSLERLSIKNVSWFICPEEEGGGAHGITGGAHQDGAQPSCIALALEQPVIREYRHAASARETPL
jgi:hypothetical protein